MVAGTGRVLTMRTQLGILPYKVEPTSFILSFIAYLHLLNRGIKQSFILAGNVSLSR
jgi:hypothetical protein